MIKNLATNLLVGSCPARLSAKLHRPENEVFRSFSPQRSGQHLVIRWLCLGLDNILHVNHVRPFMGLRGPVLLPMAGRTTIFGPDGEDDSGKRNPRRLPDLAHGSALYERELWTMEDIAPDDPRYAVSGQVAFRQVFLILRDPANWLASSLEHGKWGPTELRAKLHIYMQTLRAAHKATNRDDTLVVLFNHFVANPGYRAALSATIDGHDLARAEPALSEIPDFGGGSSFNGKLGEAGKGVTERWQAYAADPLFRELLSQDGLRPLANEVFGEDVLAFLD